jgi:hypothetical protein
MRARLIWLTFGLSFTVTLAVVVGQRLSAQAMGVLVGVVAGVAVSLPVSLLAAWLAARRLADEALVMPAPGPARASAPRVVVVAQPPQEPPHYQHYAGYTPPADPARQLVPGPAPAGWVEPAPRAFTVIGGADGWADETGSAADPFEEVTTWRR